MGKRRHVNLLLVFALTLAIAAAVGLQWPVLAGTNEWMQRQPGMYGGDVIALAFSPAYANDATLFAGTYEGGIFRSLDRGEHWQEVNEGIYAWEVKDLALSPNFANDRTLFAGTAGVVYKSTNGGDTWTRSSTGLAEVDTGVKALAISPGYNDKDNNSDKTVFAGTDHAGVFRSTDGGTNWITVTIGLTWQAVEDGLEGIDIQDLAISPDYTSTKTLFAATDGGGVFRSNNGGDSWTPVNTGLADLNVYGLVISPNFASDPVIFATTEISGVFRSNNGGDSWTLVNANVPSKLMLGGLAISPNFAGDRTVFASLDREGVVKSTDGGENWQPVNAGLSGKRLGALVVSPAFATDQTVLAGMVDGGGLYKSTNGGSTWRYTVTGITGVWVTDLATSPNFANDSLMFAAGYGTGVFRSEDRGGSWTAVNAYTTTHVSGISPAFADDHTLYAGTDSVGIFRTRDGGASWDLQDPDNPQIIAIALSPNFANDNTLFTATEEGIFKSVNRGESWSPANNGLPTQTGLPVDALSLGLSPNFLNDKTLFAGTDGRGVYRSSDGGESWLPINDGIGGGRITMLAVSPNYTVDRTVYARKSNPSDLYRSTDGGSSWSPVNIPNGWVEDMVFSPKYASDGKIYAGTHYSGVYYTSDGVSWQRLDQGAGLDVLSVNSLAVMQTDVTAVFAGTRGSGVWVHADNDIPIPTPLPTPGPPDCPVPVWNALIYLNGDNDLDYWTAILFDELEQVAVNRCVRILVLWDRSDSDDTNLYWVQPDDRPFALAPYELGVNKWLRGEQNMGNPQTLINFVIQVRANFTAAHTFLSIVDHGNGWSPSIPPGPKKYIHAGMSFDDSSGGAYLSTESLAGALGVITSGSNKLDVVFFDACLMGMTENLYPLRDFAKFVVASENETFSSYPYAEYLRELDASTEPRALAEHVVEQYNDSLSGYPHTMAAYDLARMPAVSTAVDSFARELIRVIPTQRSQIQSSFDATQKFDSDVDLRLTITDTYVDLYHFAQLVTQNVSDSAVQASAQGLMAAIQPLVLLNHKASGDYWANGQRWDVENAHGLSIYLPLGKNDFFLRYYGDRELTFARDTAWDEFIREMIPAVQAPVEPPEESDPSQRPGPVDLEPAVDTDGDNVPDQIDTDDDNDGVADAVDAFPLDKNENVDTDGDGTGNNADTDDDNDTVLDGDDDFPLDPSESVDTDSDGTGNNADGDDDNDTVDDEQDAFPLDVTESMDTDSDSTGNNADTDDDGDTVADANDAFPLNNEETTDTDGDSTGNNADPDDDNDNVVDGQDAFPLDSTESQDSDGDGIGDNADPDPPGQGGTRLFLPLVRA